MKRREMLKTLKKQGWKLLRRGARHDLYIHPFSERYAEVPRHDKELSNWVMKDLNEKMNYVRKRLEEEK